MRGAVVLRPGLILRRGILGPRLLGPDRRFRILLPRLHPGRFVMRGAVILRPDLILRPGILGPRLLALDRRFRILLPRLHPGRFVMRGAVILRPGLILRRGLILRHGLPGPDRRFRILPLRLYPGRFVMRGAVVLRRGLNRSERRPAVRLVGLLCLGHLRCLSPLRRRFVGSLLRRSRLRRAAPMRVVLLPRRLGVLRLRVGPRDGRPLQHRTARLQLRAHRRIRQFGQPHEQVGIGRGIGSQRGPQVRSALGDGGLQRVIVRLSGEGLISLIRRPGELFRIHVGNLPGDL